MSSRLGFHLNAAPEPALADIQRGAIKVSKLLDFDSEQSIALLKQTTPLVIFRKYVDADYTNISPETFVGMIPAKLYGIGLIFEGLNENVIHTIADAQLLNAWYVRFAQLLHAKNEKVGAYSFSTGNPDLALVPYLADGARASDFICLHEYAHSGASPLDQVGRYHQFLAALPDDAKRQVLITECGFDNGGGSSDGWIGNLPAPAYLAMLNQIDDVYSADGWCAGATIFQDLGGAPWKSFNIQSIAKPLSIQIAARGGGVIPPMPIVTPPIPQPVLKLTDIQLAQLVTAPQKFANPEIAIAITIAESDAHPDAIHQNTNPPSVDVGLWQINLKAHPEVSMSCAFEPACATKAAFEISNGGKDYTPWTTYKLGRHLEFIPRAKAALAIVTPPVIITPPPPPPPPPTGDRHPCPDAPWVSIEGLTNPTLPYYVVTSVEYKDPDHSGGDVNVYIYAVDENDKPIPNLRVIQQNGGITPLFTKSDPTHLGEVDFNQTAASSFEPDHGQVGAYSVYVDDSKHSPSEKVKGMGLPLRRHVSYSIHFKKVVVPVTPPVTVPTVSFSTSPTTIQQGQSATLTWAVDNAKSVYLDGVGVAGHDTKVVTPEVTTTYTLVTNY